MYPKARWDVPAEIRATREFAGPKPGSLSWGSAGPQGRRQQAANRLPVPSSRVVAGGWPSPLPPWGSPVAGRPFEVFPHGPRRPVRKEQKPTFEPWPPLQRPLRALESPSRFRLSWDSSKDRPSSVSFPVSPLPQVRGPVSAMHRPDASSCSVLVVSHHLDGLLLTERAGLLHPASGHGVHCVARLPPPRCTEVRSW